MKKSILSLFFVFGLISSFAQGGSTDHLTFKGVPVDGTLNEFVSKMKQKGFTYHGTEDGVAFLEGDFAGYKSCTLGVVAYKPKGLVSKVAVIFPESDTWSQLSDNYYTLKALLTEKYGEPSESTEEFLSSVQPEDNNSKLHEVKMDRCHYSSIFETKNGTIELSIEHNGMSSVFVLLSYYDEINTNIVKRDALNDL